jgi:hypothetical protein
MAEITDDEFKALIRRIGNYYAEDVDADENEERFMVPPFLDYDEDNETFTYTTDDNRIILLDEAKSRELSMLIRDTLENTIAEMHGGKRKSSRNRKSRKSRRSRKSRKSRKNKRSRRR